MKKVVLAGDAVTAFLKRGIEEGLARAGVEGAVEEMPTGQVDALLLDGGSRALAGRPDYVVAYQSAALAREEFWGEEEPEGWAERRLGKVRAYAERAGEAGARLIYLMPAPTEDGVWGTRGLASARGFGFQVERLRMGLMELAAEKRNVRLWDLAREGMALGRAEAFPGAGWAMHGMELGVEAALEAGRGVAGIVAADAGAVKKALVMDLDNTMWGGIVGDDGVENLRVGELGNGRAHTALQKWAKALKRRGVLLATCSKNEEAVARAPFLEHPEMTLRLEDFAGFKANWEPKAKNVAELAKELNLGLESFVFLDDRKSEREAMRAALPEVATPELPEDPADWVDFLARGNWFETTGEASGEDGRRTEMVRARLAAEREAAAWASHEEFLASLGTEVTVEEVGRMNAARAAQLTQRANQFNLRMSRCTAEELLAGGEGRVALAFGMRDRFGDHGMVGVAVVKAGGEEAEIETWVMSCRAAGRGVEGRMMAAVAEAARKAGARALRGERVEGPKNAPVAGMLGELGFEDVGGGKMILRL